MNRPHKRAQSAESPDAGGNVPRVSGRSRQPIEGLDLREQALIAMARLVLIGDHRSLRQEIRNLQRSGTGAALSPEGRMALGNLLADLSADAPIQRAETVARRLRPDSQIPVEEIIAADPPVLERDAARALDRLVREHERRHLLEEANLHPTTRVLLVGPPGSGKTMTARWLAARLELPLITADPAAILSSLMGESSKALAGLFTQASASPCILFVDELDAYARRRGEATDIGEAKRLVNTLLLELDRVSERSLVIAASNHPEALDPAVTRRFQLSISFLHPKAAQRRDIIEGVLAKAHRAAEGWLLDLLAGASKGRSASELSETVTAALRRSIIDDLELPVALTSQFVGGRFAGRGREANRRRREVADALATRGLSIEAISAMIDSTPRSTELLLSASDGAESISNSHGEQPGTGH